MALVLYDFALAPSPRRARMVLIEKGIGFETVQVDLGSGEQLGAEYRAINPECTVPALKTETGAILTNNAAIAAYAEAIKPEPALLGRTPDEKGRVAGLNSRIELDGLMPIAEVLRNSSRRMENRALPGPLDLKQIPELAERGRVRLEHFFGVLNDMLRDRDFVAGDAISVADITALVGVDFAAWVKCAPEETHTDLKRWHAMMSERPSAKA